MKKTVPLPKTDKRICTKTALRGFVFVFILLILIQGSIYAAPPPGNDTVHSIQVNKAQSSKKYKIKLYPDARQQVLFFSADGKDGKVYELFLFDMDGRLVNQTAIRNKETTVLTNIAEGDFLFEVFTDDERIENGRLTVK